MKYSVLSLAIVAGVLTGCGGDDRKVAAQQPYETVQEGSVAGVTSTIQGPGETLPPITGTNADTTTAFALNPAAVTSAASPVAPPSTTVPSYDPAPAYTPPPAQQTPRRETSSTPPPVRSAEREPSPPTPPTTETTATTAPAERSETPAETTETAVPEAEDEEPPPPPPTTTDTNPTETAPPTTTDGR